MAYWQESMWLLARSALAGDVAIGVCGFGKKCAGRRCDNNSTQLLARGVLAGDATIVVHSYWQEVCWQEM